MKNNVMRFVVICCIFKPCCSTFMIFHAKIGNLGENLYGSHTLLILYVEEKSYFIWRKIILYMEI